MPCRDLTMSSCVRTRKPRSRLSEDFSSGDMEFIERRFGEWTVVGELYEVVPASDMDGISTLHVEALPDDFEIDATINADAAAVGRLTNAFIIFDYHGPSDFNFAGAYVGSDQWIIGHRNSREWVVDASVSAPIEVMTDYDLTVRVTNDTQVTLSANGVSKVQHTYGDALSDGDAGIGTRDAVSRFDDLGVRVISAPQAQLSEGMPQGRSIDLDWIERVAPFHDQRSSADSVVSASYVWESLTVDSQPASEESETVGLTLPWSLANDLEYSSELPRFVARARDRLFATPHRDELSPIDSGLATGEPNTNAPHRHVRDRYSRLTESLESHWALSEGFEETLELLAGRKDSGQ